MPVWLRLLVTLTEARHSLGCRSRVPVVRRSTENVLWCHFSKTGMGHIASPCSARVPLSYRE